MWYLTVWTWTRCVRYYDNYVGA